MTTNPSLTALAVASSAVLIFGNVMPEKGQTFLNATPIYGTVDQVADPALDPDLALDDSIVETSPVPAQPQPVAAMKPIKKHPELKAIAAQMKESFAQTHTSMSRPIVTSSPGNTYVWGQCTWYAKNKRPDLPNSLGNGGQWVANAAALGFATGSTPRVGAIGEQPGHVVYVEAVHSNGTVTISEMNYNGGVGVVHKRTVPAGTFTYIY